MELFNSVRRTFWSEHVWMPPGLHWSDYEKDGKARFNDLYLAGYTAIVLVIVRFLCERFIFAPIGMFLGIKVRSGQKRAANADLGQKFPELETAYRKAKKLDHKTLAALAKKCDLQERQIERWLRKRQQFDRQSTLSRFQESAWRATFYGFAFAFGIHVLSDKPWLWDSMHCFIDYPNHSVSSAEWWYYNIELGFYLSLVVSQFFDVQRKDFWQMFIHHVVTILLLSFSWACNLVRIGSLVLVIHDFADIPLEGAKLARYTRSETASNAIFALFTVCWIFSRLGLLPWRVISYSTYLALKVVPMFPAYYIFNALLVALQILHVIWTWLILRIAYNAIFKDGVKDLRESDETGASQDETESLESTDGGQDALDLNNGRRNDSNKTNAAGSEAKKAVSTTSSPSASRRQTRRDD